MASRSRVKKKKIIQIDFSLENNGLRIIFKDNGRGISPKILPNVFDPFFTTNREHGGTGLGLPTLFTISYP